MMTSKKRVRKSFSVDDLRQEVANENSLQQLLGNFITFPAENALESNSRTLEAWLVSRYGLLATVEMLSFSRSAMSLPANEQQRLLATFYPNVDAKHFHVLHRVARSWPAVLKSCQMSVLTPPTSACLLCPNSPHLSVHHKCNVVVYGFDGVRQATKISTRCQRCRNIYNYTSFGNAGDGWTLYQEARDLVEASDACFVERHMFELQCSLANHCWVSFSGWSVAYNEAFGLLSNPHELSEKQVAATFWNGELEIEVRGTGQLDFYGLFHKNEDREAVMEEIERRRSQSVYVHSSDDCSQDCKKRGCGRLWVADGLWKIMFPHCAMSTKNVVSGLPLLNYPDVCTAQPQHGKAFCLAHCRFIESSHPEVPTDLRGFLQYCGVLRNTQLSADDLESATRDTNVSDVEKLKSVVQQLSNERSSTVGISVIESQGNASVLTLNDAEINTILDDCVETHPTTCNKDTGEKQALQKWSRGHFFIVRGSGIIDKWNPLFRSESPSQPFLFLIEWMLVTLKDIPESQWGDIFLSYDNMCHVDGMNVARKALPFHSPFDNMWLKVNKIIDSLHISNHKSGDCKEKYNPAKLKDKLPDGNTMAGEQTFTWLSRFKKILCSMPRIHHMFFLHRMIVRRNAYTVTCYKNGKKPLLPKARKGT